MAVTDDAILRVKRMILAGELRPGDRLPREADLAERLGLSRSSLREAVRALSLVRVLDVRQGDGTYVASLEAHDLLGALSLVLDLHRDERSALEVHEVRRVLEPVATMRAATRVDAQEITALRALCAEAEDTTSVDRLVELDAEFHRRVVAAAGNAAMTRLLETLTSAALRAEMWGETVRCGGVADVVAEHRAIVDALAARQPDLARSWATVHLASVQRWLARGSEPVS
ncbi:FadR/GntR family transcriptional regulator [Streptoalloteichus hindustanus]|uniref:Transcriptional regulator, GntR family n=1 Tax=Streptoalloteichus hindustanus TaxID=2017 RepID=A0A1M4W6I1_STRHI|nr:FCD domain-containing protein [Streptoalloteichus hindustanus]SHE76809.1 transcriptional regulator, GntR family [Streptoalloteichus hindustanus]